MIEINFSGKKIFEFKDNSFIQITGWNEELKRLIVNIYFKIFNGYKFSDIDMEAMNGHYPEVTKEGRVFKKDDIIVIRISSIDDILQELQIKNNSVLFKYLLSLGKELSINRVLSKVEESLTELSIELDELMKEKIAVGDIAIITNIHGIDFKKIANTFIGVEFIDFYNQRKPLWLLKDREVINLFLNIIGLIIEENNNVTVIIDGLDIGIGLETYNYFTNKLYDLTEEYFNFKTWLIPKTKEGIRLDYKIFENTYILNDNVVSLGNFDITYESICRNYPDNNLPTKTQVMESLLKLFPFHHSNKDYFPSKEIVILQVFLKLLHENPVRVNNTGLSSLETKFLTSLKI